MVSYNTHVGLSVTLLALYATLISNVVSIYSNTHGIYTPARKKEDRPGSGANVVVNDT